jgi:hypothetical protein
METTSSSSAGTNCEYINPDFDRDVIEHARGVRNMDENRSKVRSFLIICNICTTLIIVAMIIAYSRSDYLVYEDTNFNISLTTVSAIIAALFIFVPAIVLLNKQNVI